MIFLLLFWPLHDISNPPSLFLKETASLRIVLFCKWKESFEEMSSAKHFFLKLTERDRPTVKLTGTSRGRGSFSQLRDKGTLCVRESVLLSRKEVV